MSHCGLAPGSATRFCRPSGSICAHKKSFSQKLRGVIGLGADHTPRIDEFIKSDLEISRRKDVVGVRSKTICDWEKSADPVSSARRHSGEMRVNMANPHLLQAQPDVNSLVKSKEIGATAPLVESSDNLCIDLSFFGSQANGIQQLLFFW